MQIKGLKFIKTCPACPEQYDVFDQNNNIVGYIRLRWGALTCEFPDVGGECIYSAYIGDDWCGSFSNLKERDFHLKRIASKINKKIKKNKIAI